MNPSTNNNKNINSNISLATDINLNTNTNTSSLATEISKALSENKKDELEENLDKREDILQNKTLGLQEIREDTHKQEISKIIDKREAALENRRKFKQNLQVDYCKSLKDCLTINKDVYTQCFEMTVDLSQLEGMILAFKDSDLLKKYQGLVGIRKLLSMKVNPPVQAVIDAELVYEFVGLLDSTSPEFVFEAIWCLTNITSGTADQSNSVVNKGGHEKLVNLIDSKFIEIQEQALWSVGNIASESSKNRDKLVNLGAINKMYTYLKTAGDNQKLVNNIMWSLSNFAKGKVSLDYELFKPVSIIFMHIKYSFLFFSV